MRKKTICLLLVFYNFFILLGDLVAQSPNEVPEIAIQRGKEAEVIALETGRFQLDGMASFYAEKFHNRTTANGETYNMNAYTAAHRTLPFNTVVEVKNELNGKIVTVRINDRGPYLRNRVIDLSRQAAKVLDMVHTGIVPVTLTVIHYGKVAIRKNTESGMPTYITKSETSIQIASYSQIENAERTVQNLASQNIYSTIQEYNNLYRIIVDKIKPAELNPTISHLNTMGFSDIIVKHSN